MSRKRVAIIIPAYNEEAVIKDTLSNVIKFSKAARHDISVVVVNDGSADRTEAIAKTMDVVVINHILNCGAGSATATGLSFANQAGFEIAATMDADGQHDPIDVIRGIDKLIATRVDLLIGSRLIDSRGMSRIKVLGNKGLSMITYFLFGIRSTDSQSGLRIFSKHALENLRWKTSGYEFCSEMLWRANQQGLIIREYPIKAIYTEYSRGKGQNNWNGVNILKSLIKRRLIEIFE